MLSKFCGRVISEEELLTNDKEESDGTCIWMTEEDCAGQDNLEDEEENLRKLLSTS